MATRFRLNFEPVLDAHINPLAFGTITFYESGTEILASIYSDDALSVPKLNPVTLDTDGKHSDIFLQAKDYRVIVNDAAGAPLSGGDVDPVHGGVGSGDVTFIQDGTGAVERTVQDKLRERGFSVKDFGAKGDGTTDDTAAINACIEAAYNNAIDYHSVFFPVGVYMISSPIGFKASFIGEEQNNTFIRAKSTFTGSYLVDMGAATHGSGRMMLNIFFDLRDLGAASMVTSLGSSSSGGGAGSFSTTWLNCRWIGASALKAILDNNSPTAEPGFTEFGAFIGCSFSSRRCVRLGNTANVVKFITCEFDNGGGGSPFPIDIVGGVNVSFDTCAFEFTTCGGPWFHVGPGTLVVDNCFAEGTSNILDDNMFQIDAQGAASNPEARLHIRQLTLNVNYTPNTSANGLVLIIGGAGAGAFRSCYVSVDGIYRSSGGGVPWNNIFSLMAQDANATGPIRLSIKDCDEMGDISQAHSGSVATGANVVWALQGWWKGTILNHTAPHPANPSRLTWTWHLPAASFTD